MAFGGNMKGSEDWIRGWYDHREFIKPYRTTEVVGWCAVGFVAGVLLMSFFV